MTDSLNSVRELEPGDVCYWRGYKAELQYRFSDHPTYAKVILFPQPGVNGDTRYRDVLFEELTLKP